MRSLRGRGQPWAVSCAAPRGEVGESLVGVCSPRPSLSTPCGWRLPGSSPGPVPPVCGEKLAELGTTGSIGQWDMLGSSGLGHARAFGQKGRCPDEACETPYVPMVMPMPGIGLCLGRASLPTLQGRMRTLLPSVNSLHSFRRTCVCG